MAWNRNSYPSSVQMGAHTINVKVLDKPLRTEGDDLVIGAYRPQDKEITVSHLDCETVSGENFLHELMEAANDMNDLQLSHQTITTLAASLFQALNSGEVTYKPQEG